MGEIVRFPTETARRAAPHEAQHHLSGLRPEGAQILFFLGVRYERHIDAAPNAQASTSATPPKTRQGPKRRSRRG